MADDSSPEDEQKVVELIQAGSELAGAVAGAAIGMIAGPESAMVGGAAGVMVTRGLKRVGAEVGRRWLSPRQQIRMGVGLACAVARIQERLIEGEAIRDDGFFDQAPGRRSDAEELLEGVLLQVVTSYQEARIPYIAHLYSSTVFDEIDSGYANFLLRMSERLSFRQLVSLALISDGVAQDLLTQAGAPAAPAYYFSDEVAVELDELATFGLIGVCQPGGRVIDPRTGRWGGNDGFRSVILGDAALSEHGRQLAGLMELRDIPSDARLKLARQIWTTSPPASQ